MHLYGEALAVVLDTDLISTGKDLYANESRFYDLISWDPRGVGHTTPLVEGISDPLIREEFNEKSLELSAALRHREIFNRAYAIKETYGQLISSPQDGIPNDEHPARFVGTTSVVRDMVEIVEKHGEWRDRIAEKTLTRRSGKGEHITTAERGAIRERTMHHKGQEKLQYWGFSYGTIVGQV